MDTKDKIRSIYDSMSNHKVNRELTISNGTEDYDLFASIVISGGCLY